MKTEKPAAPVGCKALWQDPVTKDWVLIDKDLDIAGWDADREEWDYCYDFDESVTQELLRLAAQRDRLVEGLELAATYLERSAPIAHARVMELLEEHRGQG